MRKLTEFFDHKTRRLTNLKWTIDGYDNYCFAENKRCYNRTTGLEINMVLKGYTKGYNLNSRFLSLKQIRPLLKMI
jgi:hypothetical protein